MARIQGHLNGSNQQDSRGGGAVLAVASTQPR